MKHFEYTPSSAGKGLYPEIYLWRMVIVQALMDLCIRSSKKMKKIARIHAICYFNLYDKEFIMACRCAELDPIAVYDRSQIVKKSNEVIYDKNTYIVKKPGPK